MLFGELLMRKSAQEADFALCMALKLPSLDCLTVWKAREFGIFWPFRWPS